MHPHGSIGPIAYGSSNNSLNISQAAYDVPMAMLTEPQLQTLHAAMDTLIPPDENPGAWDNGAGDYLLRQFEGDLAHAVLEYRIGLDALDREAHTVYGNGFAQLPLEQRTALLAAIEDGNEQAPWPVPAASFLTQLVNHTAEGYYADPAQGGNPACASWDMIGFHITG